MVEYDQTKQANYVDQVFRWGVEELSKNWYLPSLAGIMKGKLNVLGVKVKHPKFHEEREARIIKRLLRILTPEGATRYDGGNAIWRNGKYGPTQYTELDLDVKNAIKRIVVGPRGGGHVGVLKEYLTEKQMPTVAVVESQCPYR